MNEQQDDVDMWAQILHDEEIISELNAKASLGFHIPLTDVYSPEQINYLVSKLDLFNRFIQLHGKRIENLLPEKDLEVLVRVVIAGSHLYYVLQRWPERLDESCVHNALVWHSLVFELFFLIFGRPKLLQSENLTGVQILLKTLEETPTETVELQKHFNQRRKKMIDDINYAAKRLVAVAPAG